MLVVLLILAPNMRHFIIILLATTMTTLVSCSNEYGHQVVGGNLTVYFTDENDEKLAAEIAKFWKNNELLTEQPQDIQLNHHKSGYQLCLIAKEKSGVKNMPFEERKALLELQKQLQNEVFGDNDLELLICDNHFKPIYNINE